jgi:GntR family transcriptional regulator of vanillate catabolism
VDSQQTRALVKIREMILAGELVPGERVAEAPLADRLGMSRTPIRKALPVLAQEGLLTEHATRGYRVRGFSTADILDAIDLRGVLEGLAARRIAERGASQELLHSLAQCLTDGDQLLAKAALEADDEARYVDMNARFHDLIIAAAHSPMIEQALERNARIPFASPKALAFDRNSHERMREALIYAHQQHHSIVSALERGEGGRVEALMREHVYPVKESLNIAADADASCAPAGDRWLFDVRAGKAPPRGIQTPH